jgi:hypothetical protein
MILLVLFLGLEFSTLARCGSAMGRRSDPYWLGSVAIRHDRAQSLLLFGKRNWQLMIYWTFARFQRRQWDRRAMLEGMALAVATQWRPGGPMETDHDDWTVGFASYPGRHLRSLLGRQGVGRSLRRASMEADES